MIQRDGGHDLAPGLLGMHVWFELKEDKLSQLGPLTQAPAWIRSSDRGGSHFLAWPDEDTAVHRCNQHILAAFELARKLIALADEGLADAEDDSCSVFYGVMRDCGYKIRQQAEHEKQMHIAQGRWDVPLDEAPVFGHRV